MTAKESILSVFAMSEKIVPSYLAGLTAADLLIRAEPGMNHIAWQLGHLILTERNLLNAVRPDSSPDVPANFEDGHGRKQTEVDDPSNYLPPDEYIQLMMAQREATKLILGRMTEAELDDPAPESTRRSPMAQTLGGVFLLMGTHYVLHVGQFVAVRRKLGKPIAF